jgi:hypothetical protein
VNLQKLPGTLVKVGFLNSTCVWLKLVKYVENRRKFKKCNLNFVGFVVKNPTTFVILA